MKTPMRIGRYRILVVCSLLVVAIFALLVEYIMYPMSLNDVMSRMDDKEVLFEGRQYGITIFITQQGEHQVGYIFNESMFLPTHRQRDAWTHTPGRRWDLVIGGKWRQVRLDDVNEQIVFAPEGV